MEQNNETNATGSRRLSRVFTKKRLGGLAAVIALVLLAGGGATYYQQTQARAAHAQERAAMSQLNAIQAEKMGVTLLKEAQIRSIAADAIGQEETAVTFDEIDLMTGRQARAGKEKEQERRDGRKRSSPRKRGFMPAHSSLTRRAQAHQRTALPRAATKSQANAPRGEQTPLPPPWAESIPRPSCRPAREMPPRAALLRARRARALRPTPISPISSSAPRAACTTHSASMP